MMRLCFRRLLLLSLLLCAVSLFAGDGKNEGIVRAEDPDGESEFRIPDEQFPLNPNIPNRPKPIIEWGDKLLGQGPIQKGFRIPTGAVWQPTFWAFGAMRSAVQTFDNGTTSTTEWANRLNLFGNLRLTGTERLVVGLRPLDEKGRFSGYQFDDDGDDVWAGNAEVRTLFFEGDLAEVFPRWGRNGNQPKQLGFSVGRQPLFIQEGIMINDNIDSVGLTRNNIPVPGTSNFRSTFLFGWGEVGRDNNIEDNSAKIYGWFNQADIYRQTVDFDIAYVDADETYGSGFFVGLSNYQPIGRYNTAVRVNASFADGDVVGTDPSAPTANPATNDGVLIFTEVSWSPKGRQDIIYANTFWGIDEYTSASRGPTNGGPVGRLGLLFASVGLGKYGAPLGNRVQNAAGFALGYQYFWGTRRQLIFELGGRAETKATNAEAGKATDLALGTRFQQALGQHFILQFDAFGSYVDNGGNKFGGRCEVIYKF